MRELKRALVTGAAGGIGRALAVELGRAGLEVACADRDLAALAGTIAAVEATRAAAALALQMDVTDSASIDRACERLRRELGPPDLLINNAGVVHGGTVVQVSADEHLHTVAVNLAGPILVTRTFLPELLAADAAHVVNVASASGFIGLPFGSSYAASKWGLIGFSESLRRELEVTGHRHVGVTTVCPGYAETGMFAGATAPRLTRFLSPEALARRTLRAIARNRPFVLTPWPVRLAPALRGIVPTRVLDLLSDGFGATRSMERWRGHGR